MHFSLACRLATLSLAAASPAHESIKRASTSNPAAFFLAGDSTTAVQSTGGGGWGSGFLGTLANGAIGTNFGHNGATTVSFVEGGDWANVLAAVEKNKISYTPYVTIQFGHNDQKPAKNITVEQYKANLKTMAKDVVAAGGTPILVTPLSRRKFLSNGLVSPDLMTQVNATLEVASSISSAFIDLNKASMDYLNSIGENDARMYNLAEVDTTHLNAAGSVVFGNMVAHLISGSAVGSAVTSYLSPNETVLSDIASGTFILPTV